MAIKIKTKKKSLKEGDKKEEVKKKKKKLFINKDVAKVIELDSIEQLPPDVQIDEEGNYYTSVGMRMANFDWDDDYKKDIESGIGFDIDDPNGINKNNVRSPRGIYSSQYGADISEDSDYQATFSCKCKALKGRFNCDGKTKCKICGSLVEKNNNMMEKTGWMSLKESLHLINPLYYYMLERIIGKKQLNNMIYYNKERDEDGNVVINMDYFDEKNPFYAIGIMEFYERFDEILDYYKDNIKGNPSLRRDKLELYEFLKENKEAIFCNHFPVYTLMLRPILMIKNNMVYANINTKYQSLLVNLCELNKDETTIDSKELKILPLLYQSQQILNQIHKLTIEEQVSGKEGHIRSSMLGERVNFSSRCVIIPLIGRYNLDEIKLPYLVFLELYKYEIINLLCKMDNLTINQAVRKWNKGIEKFDRKLYLIMKHIIENTKGGCYCFVNRNPSLNYGSMLSMRVVDVKEDFEDLTLSVPLNILGLLAADFDGDVVNIVSLKGREFVSHYDRLFNPRGMMIDRNDGLFNRKMNLIKDQMIGLYSFCKD